MSNDPERFLEAEQAVLGSMLLDAGCVKTILAKLEEDDFSLELNSKIFRVLRQMDLDGKPIDHMTAAEAMREIRDVDEESLRSYLRQLWEITPTSANAEEYADIVLERSRRRHLRQALQSGLDQLDSGADGDTILPELEASIERQRERASGDLLSPAQQIERFYQRRELIDTGGKPYVRTGFRPLDKKLSGGMQNGGLYYLAARPGMGKTTLALSIAEYVAQTVGDVLFVTLEMSDQQLTSKRLAALAKVNYGDILSGELLEDEYRRIAEAAQKISKTPLVINHRPTATAAQIAAMARGKRHFRLVVIDHFSLIQTTGRRDRVQEYTEVSNSLKRLAIVLDIPILVLAQLNRQNEQRSSKRPMLSDLRETGAAEQDADGVITLHRPDYYETEHGQEDTIQPVLVECCVAKNRHGATGRIDLSFYRQTGIFKERFVK